ncbi:hypothetical protein APHAL10511_003816 [Amanita phalloides]|nr:hypothetical protein APHAL10511_003816 [Amanita phalloides]
MTREQHFPPLSIRGQKQAETGKKFEQFEKSALNAYHRDNPQGTVNLGIADNTLLYRELVDYFKRNFHLTCSDLTYCASHRGDPRLCHALADFINTYFNPCKPVNSSHIVVGAGLVAILSQLVGALTNPGDGVLVASPYYYGYDTELMAQQGVAPVGVAIPKSDMFTPAELDYFERALVQSNKKGTRIKAVILCNPHNPLGLPYPEDAIIEYGKFCEKHNLQLICDEVYALSVFSSRDVPVPEPFISALSLDLESHGINPCRVHVLYGMSKDFSCSGFRLGALITSPSNKSLIHSMIISAFFSCPSSPAMNLWATLLSDKPFLSHFLKTNRLKLQEAYDYMSSWLRFHKIPYMPSSAGHFILVDMRPVLSDMQRYGSLLSLGAEEHAEDDMAERETALLEFFSKHGVWLTPGSACHMEHGWFRVTFSLRRDFIDVALARMEDALGWERWPGLLGAGPPLEQLLPEPQPHWQQHEQQQQEKEQPQPQPRTELVPATYGVIWNWPLFLLSTARYVTAKVRASLFFFLLRSRRSRVERTLSPVYQRHTGAI